MVVNQVLLLLLKPQPYVPAKTFATNCNYLIGRIIVELPVISNISSGFRCKRELRLEGKGTERKVVCDTLTW